MTHANINILLLHSWEHLVSSTLMMRLRLLQGKGSGAEGVQKLVDAMGGGQISDAGYLAEILDKVIANNQKQLEQYRGGKNKLKGHFVG